MKRIFLVLIFELFLTTFSFGQLCSNSPQSVVVRGFYLGMTEDAAKKRYPKIIFFKDLDVVGLTSWTLPPSGSSDDIFTESEREGLESVQLKFFDKKLSQIKIVYNGFTEWDSLKEFTDASSKALKLPLADGWQKTSDENSIKIVCKDFYVISHLEPVRGAYELQEPSLFFSFNDFETKLDARKNSQKENQKKIFKP